MPLLNTVSRALLRPVACAVFLLCLLRVEPFRYGTQIVLGGGLPWWLRIALALALGAGLRFWARRAPISWRAAIAATLLVNITILCGSVAWLAIRDSRSWSACRAPGRGDCDEYMNYAQYFAGQPAFFYESALFKKREGYNPFETRIHLVADPRGDRFYSAGGDGKLRRWDWSARPQGEPVAVFAAPVTSLKLSSSGQELALSAWKGPVAITTLEGKVRRRIESTGQISVTAMAIDPRGELLATAGWDGSLKLFNYRTLEPVALAAPAAHEATIYGVAFTPDGRYVVTGASDWTLQLWARDGRYLGRLAQDTSPFTDVRAGPGPSAIVASNYGGKLYRCTIPATVTDVGALKGACVESSSTMTYASLDQSATAGTAGGSFEGNLELQQPGGDASPWVGHWSTTIAVQLSPDGRRLASAARDGTLKVWNARTHALVAEATGVHPGYVPAKTLGIAHHLRQPGFPFLISLYMRATGAFNSCSVLFFQPLLYILFCFTVLALARRSLGSAAAFALLLPLADPTNNYIFFSQYDFTEFSLAALYPLMAILIAQAATQAPGRRRCVAILALLLAAAGLIKMLSFIFFAVGILLFVALAALTPVARRRVSFRTLAVLFAINAGLSVAASRLSPEAVWFNRTNLNRNLLLIPAPVTQVPLLERYRRAQTLVYARYVRIFHKTAVENHETDNYIIHEFGSGVATGYDEHAKVDLRTGEVMSFTPSELEWIANQLVLRNPLSLVKYAAEELWLKRRLLKFELPFSAQGERFMAWKSRIFFVFACLGIGALLRLGPVALALPGSLAAMYVFFALTWEIDLRYWSMFSGFYYFFASQGLVWSWQSWRRVTGIRR